METETALQILAQLKAISAQLTIVALGIGINISITFLNLLKK